MKICLWFPDEGGIVDLAGFESISVCDASDGRSKLIRACRRTLEKQVEKDGYWEGEVVASEIVAVVASDQADEKELAAAQASDVIRLIAASIALNEPICKISIAQMPGQALMRKIGEHREPVARETSGAVPGKRLIVHLRLGESSEQEIAALAGRTIKEVKQASDRVVALITDGER